MRKLFACLISVAAATLVAGAAAPAGTFVVHEWGTFLAMSGSDGVTLDGMYHEEHALPSFVHARGANELRLPTSNMKGETPVIYFYSDTTRQVQVQVGFPGGLWTQWFPQASFVGPSLVQTGSPLRPRNGRIAWSVYVEPPPLSPPALPAVSGDALWNFSRQVDAAFVRPMSAASAAERERFIFYRGLGEARLPFTVSATDARVECGRDLTEGLRHIYLLRVEGGRGVSRYVPSLRCGERLDEVVPSMADAQPLDRFVDGVADDFTRRLVESGLYEKEARAMTNTWRTSYFANDGVRVLFVLPQSWTDRFIPMQVSPTPDELVRVMVGRIEVLTPAREREVESAISELGSPHPAVRERAFATLRAQGRYVEPLVRRTLASTTDERVRTLCRRLLLTDFVTDLRTSVTDAATGARVVQEPVFVRAQLAAVLRDIGLDDEARQEGERALEELARLPAPSLTEHSSRHTYRALARATEGAGRDREALRWYGEFIEFGTRFADRTCAGCHGLAGPRDTSFFKDWWAGERYAAIAARTGQAARLIEAEQALLARAPDSLVAQIRLAYLYQERGEATLAARLWSRVDPRSAQTARSTP